MTEQKKAKKKIRWGGFLYILVCMLIGVGLGIILGEAKVNFDFSHVLVMFVSIVAGAYLHIILHEGGHMICGLMTGYRFLSFRVGSLMWERKKDGKIRLSKFSLAGTGGQCLMQPPEYNNGDFPYLLYNLGGGLANFILAAICGLLLIFITNDYTVVFLTIMIFLGIALGAVNLIPFKSQNVNNDGSNILAIGKSKAAKKAFWLQMQSNYCLAMGQRLKEMPDEWFEPFAEEDCKNVMVTTIAVLSCNRLMDQLDISAAEEKMLKLVNDPAVAGIYRKLLLFDLACCELLRGKTDGYVNLLGEKENAAFAKAMKNFPSILRTQYAKAMLVDDDAQSAQKILTAFEKMTVDYPHPCELEGEWELIHLIQETGKKASANA